MKVDCKLDKIPKPPKLFIESYLESFGIDDVDKWLEGNTFDDPALYPNTEKCAKLLKNSLEKCERSSENSLEKCDIGILNDPDVDGVHSSFMIYDFIKRQGIESKIFFHKGKAHGLRLNSDEDIVQQIIDSKINLLIIPDAGSNDWREIEKLKSYGIDTIVLDHHEITEEKIPEYIVNHHLAEDKLNTNLSGTGVTYKFIQYYCKKYKIKMPEYRDLVAISLISDECSFVPYENRSFLKQGQEVIKKGTGNKFIKFLIDTVAKGEYYTKNVSWKIIPLFNSVCRSPNLEYKEQMFRALAGELPPEVGLTIGQKAHSEQVKIVNKMAKEVESTIDFSKKVLVGFTEADLKTYIGLTANKFTGRFHKPTLVLREASPTTWSGSLRSTIDLSEEINETELASCQGHSRAAGIILKKSNLPRLEDWFDQLDLNEETIYPVTGEFKTTLNNVEFCSICAETNPMWGISQAHEITVPEFYFTCNINKKKIEIIGKKKDTIKFVYRNFTFIKFKCSEEELDKIQNYDIISLEMIIKLNVNEYGGITTCQGIIQELEIKEYDDMEDY